MKKDMKIAIVGAGSLDAKELYRRLVASGFDRENILTFGSKVGPWEISLEDEEAEVFLPLERQYLAGADFVFVFACDGEARRRVAEWTDAIGATLVDSGGTPAAGDAPSDPFGDLSLLKRGDGSVVIPSPAPLYLASFLGHIPESGHLQVDCTVFEPASTLGEAGVQELFHQAASLLNFQAVPTETFGTQSAFSLTPSTRWDGESFERQVKSLLGRELEIASVGVTAPLFHVYTISTFIGVENAQEIEKEVRYSVGNHGPFRLLEDAAWPDYAKVADSPIPLAAIRSLSGNKLWVWLQFNHVGCGTGALADKVLSRLRP